MDLSFLHQRCLNAIERCHYIDAIFYANKLLTLDPENIGFLFLLSRCYYLSGQYRRVIFLIESRNCQDLRCRYLSAQCRVCIYTCIWSITLIPSQALCDDWKGSLELIPEEDYAVLMTNGDNHLLCDIYMLKGKCCEALDLQAKAQEWYKMALEVDIHCYEAWEVLLNHALITTEEAEEFLDTLPFDDENHWLKAIYQCKIRKFNKDLLEKETLKTLEAYCLNDNEDVLSSHAEALFYCNQYKEAYDITQKMIDNDIYCQNAMLVHISCLVALGKKNDLYRVAHQLVEESPKSAMSWYAVGCYYFSIGNNNQAKRYFTKSTLVGRDFGPSHLALGHTFAIDREHDQAMAAYRTSSRLLIGSHIPSLSIGIEYLNVYNDELAEDFIKKAIEMQPHDPYPLNEIGVLYYRNDNFKKAATYFKKVLDHVGEDHLDDSWEPTVFNLAHCYRRLRKYDEAILYYQLSIKILPSNSSTYSALGFTYHLQRDFEMALQCYQQALVIQPDDQFTNDMLSMAITTRVHTLNLKTLE